MRKLSRRSIAAVLRSGSTRYRNTVAPISYSLVSVGDSDSKKRWFSVQATSSHGVPDFTKGFYLNDGLARRFESTAAASDMPSPPEKYEYQAAEVSHLMYLIVNSLYSNKEVFLRELISNASDALDKLRFLSVTEPQLMKEAAELDIRIQTDKDNGTITITDTGIGMTKQELIDCLGTIAQSGTAKFLKALKDIKDAGGDINLTGQFGVGFYSAFLVADKVVVSTKSPKSDKQYVWEGEANDGSYTIREETDPQALLPRGTRLTLYLKRDEKGFAHPEKIQKLVKNYSQFVSFPIYTWQEMGYTKEDAKTADEAVTVGSAIDGGDQHATKYDVNYSALVSFGAVVHQAWDTWLGAQNLNQTKIMNAHKMDQDFLDRNSCSDLQAATKELLAASNELLAASKQLLAGAVTESWWPWWW